jgi:hypothetical protein
VPCCGCATPLLLLLLSQAAAAALMNLASEEGSIRSAIVASNGIQALVVVLKVSGDVTRFMTHWWRVSSLQTCCGVLSCAATELSESSILFACTDCTATSNWQVAGHCVCRRIRQLETTTTTTTRGHCFRPAYLPAVVAAAAVWWTRCPGGCSGCHREPVPGH